MLQGCTYVTGIYYFKQQHERVKAGGFTFCLSPLAVGAALVTRAIRRRVPLGCWEEVRLVTGRSNTGIRSAGPSAMNELRAHPRIDATRLMRDACGAILALWPRQPQIFEKIGSEWLIGMRHRKLVGSHRKTANRHAPTAKAQGAQPFTFRRQLEGASLKT